MDSRLGLPKNTVLDGSYRIERVIGSGGFGVTYLAEDVNLKTTVALKEYYPVEFGDRDRTMSVRPKSDQHKQTFEWGRSSFLQEARMLAKFRHPSIVRVTRVFEANATAYMVMDFEQGHDLHAWLESLGRPPTQAELDRIAAPLLDALETMHAADFLHRDIAPDNIVIRTDGTPVLLDFGAARRTVAELSRSLTGIVKIGYSPHEQYAADGRLQGPWTDLYALGATLYRAIAEHQPEEATLRMTDDRMLPAAKVGGGKYRPGFLAAIDACLKVMPAERPQSVAKLRPLLLGQGSPPGAERATGTVRLASEPRQAAPVEAPPRRGAGRWLGMAAALLAVLGGAYVGVEYARRHAREQAALEAEVKQTAQAEAKRKVDADAAQRRVALEAEAEAKRKQDERLQEAARQDALRKEEARREAEAQEAARRKAETETKRKAEQDATRQADADAAKKKTEQGSTAIGPPQPGEPIRVASPSSWNKDCVSDPLPQVSVVVAPKHGRIEFRSGMSQVRRVMKGTGKCLGTTQNARIVDYIPSATPAAVDYVSLGILNARGAHYVIDCTVQVLERKSECRRRQ